MFELRVNGQKVWDTEAQVIGVSMHSAKGELAKSGISDEGVIDVRIECVLPGSPMRLDQLEDMQRRMAAAIREGQVTGNPPVLSDPSMNVRQFPQDDTLRVGGPDSELAKRGQNAHPSVDLTKGLDPGDPNFSEKVTARLERFNETGDAQEAIKDEEPVPVAPDGSEVPEEAEENGGNNFNLK